MRIYRFVVALLILFVALASTLVNGATPAYAHAIVVRTDPADGVVLGGPPPQLRLWFSEPITLGLASFELADSAGSHIAIIAHSNAASAALAVRNQNSSAVEVVLDLPALPPSVYRLSWNVLSNSDLHTTVGSIVFGVQRATDGSTAAAEPLPTPIEIALRWLNLGALAALLGALALVLLALPQALRAPSVAQIAPEQIAHTRGRILALAEWSSTVALLAGLALLLAQVLVAGGSLAAGLVSAWEIMSGTSYGLAWLVRQAALVLLVVLIGVYRQRMGRLGTRLTTWLALPMIVLALVIALAQAFQSHIAAGSDVVLLRVAAGAVHIVAASVWSGGLLALSVAIVPLLRAGLEQMVLAWAILRRFGALAAGSLVALLITGLFMSGQQVASLDALLTTLYGRALLLKLGLVACVALIGLRNAAALHPRVAALLRWLAAARTPFPLDGKGARSDARLGRTVLLETLGMSTILLLAAFLSAAQPARGTAFDPPVADMPAAAISHADDLVVSLALKPNRPGQNFVALGVFDTRRPAPAPIDTVAVQFLTPGQPPSDTRIAAALGKGRYQATDDSISSAGAMTISVTVRRAGMPDAVATLPWTVLPAAQPLRAVLVSNQPLAPAADRAALAIALLLGGWWALRWIRRLTLHASFFKTIKSGAAARRLRPLRKD